MYIGEIRAHLIWSVISLLHAITNVNFSFMQTSLSNSVVIHISFRMEMSLIQIKHSLISNLVSGWVTINFPSHYLNPVVHNQRRIVSLVWFRKRPLLDRNAEPCHIIIKNSTPPTHTRIYFTIIRKIWTCHSTTGLMSSPPHSIPVIIEKLQWKFWDFF